MFFPESLRRCNNFQPRIGLAWAFHPKWVFRSNFTLMTVDLLTNGLSQNFEEYFATASVQAPTGDPRTVFSLSQGPPPITFTALPNGTVPYIGTNYGSRNATWYDPNMRMPYVMKWSGGFQWQFKPTWLLDASYQGSGSVGLMNTWNINVQPIGWFPSDPVQLNKIFQNFQNYKPWPQFGSVNLVSNFGHSTYHSATIRFEKRLSAGLMMNAFYTWSKALDEADNDGTASGITYYDRRLEKARASFDVRHRWITNLTYELPVGRGRKWLNHGGFANGVFGGWEAVWIQTVQTGPPFTANMAGSPYNYLPGVGNRPNQILPDDQVKLEHVDIGPNRFPFSAEKKYINPNGFAYPAAFTIGTLGRNTLEGPGIFWVQTSLQKSWLMFREKIRFTLRADCNNCTKYHSFALPNSTYNIHDPNFGTFSGTRGSFSDVGTDRWHLILVFRLQW